MSYPRRTRKSRLDWLGIGVFFLLIIIGWFMINAVSQGTEDYGFFDLQSQVGKQLLWIIISVAIFIFLQLIDFRIWVSVSYVLYGVGILLLILVLIFGVEINASKSWFRLGSTSFQPSEFAKFCTTIGLAFFLSNYKTQMQNLRDRLISIGIIFIPVVFILLQPDAGSALVFLSLFIVLFRAGMNGIWFLLALLLFLVLIMSFVYHAPYIILGLISVLALLFIYNLNSKFIWFSVLVILLIFSVYLIDNKLPVYGLLGPFLYLLILGEQLYRRKMGQFAILSIGTLTILSSVSLLSTYIFNHMLQAHQQERINVWLRPELCDPRGSLYNLMQSKMAIGSGGLFGKGYMDGNMTKLNYVPEQMTDFIFCSIGEEFGFIGTSIICILYFTLFWRIVQMAEHMKSPFEMYYAYGIASIFFIHFFVNIGMTIGVMPVIGIPLPLISYGGTSLLIFTMMFALVIKFYSERFRL